MLAANYKRKLDLATRSSILKLDANKNTKKLNYVKKRTEQRDDVLTEKDIDDLICFYQIRSEVPMQE